MNIKFFSNKTKTEYFLVPVTSNYTLIGKNMITSLHRHPVYHIMFVTEGNGFIENDEGKYPVEEKDIFIVNPDEKHILSSSSNDGFTYITFNFYLEDSNKRYEIKKLQELFDFEMKDIYFQYNHFLWEKISAALNIFLDALEKIKLKKLNSFDEKDEKEQADYINLFSKLLWDFYLILSSRNDISEFKKEKILLNKITEYFHENIHSRFSLSELSSYTNYNGIYLCSYFKQNTGFTLNSYFYRLKIIKSCEYLRSTSKSIEETANILGFKSSSHFCRRFKDEKNLTPSEYRIQVEKHEF